MFACIVLVILATTNMANSTSVTPDAIDICGMVRDNSMQPVNYKLYVFDNDITLINTSEHTGVLSLNSVPNGGYFTIDAMASKGVSVTCMNISVASSLVMECPLCGAIPDCVHLSNNEDNFSRITRLYSDTILANLVKNENLLTDLKYKAPEDLEEIIIENHGTKNPVKVEFPVTPVKFVEITTNNINYETTEIRISYSDEDVRSVNEKRLVIYHFDGDQWIPLETTIDTANNVLTAQTDSLSPFGVGTSWGYINAIVARNVIIDDCYGWNDKNFVTGVSTTQYVNLVAITSDGHPIQGASVTGYFTAKNGTTDLFSFSGTTDVYGEFNASANLDEQVQIGQISNDGAGPNEGIWNVTMNVTYSGVSTIVTRDFRLGEYGCGRSSGACHEPASGGVGDKSNAMDPSPVFSHDPYIGGLSADGTTQGTHIVYARTTDSDSGHEHGSGDESSNTDMRNGYNCLTCHRGYDQANYTATEGSYLDNGGSPVTTYGDLHADVGLVCIDCHLDFMVGSYNQFRYDVPQCYANNESGFPCHTNTVNIPIKWVQSQTDSYSWNQKAHDTNATVSCRFCHGPFHTITTPNSSAGTVANGVTEEEHCLDNCHQDQKFHNGTVGCTVCHSQAAHQTRYFNATGGYPIM